MKCFPSQEPLFHRLKLFSEFENINNIFQIFNIVNQQSNNIVYIQKEQNVIMEKIQISTEEQDNNISKYM